MIKIMTPSTNKFIMENFLGILEATELRLRQFVELSRVDIVFIALNFHPSLSKSASTNGDYASSKSISEEDRNREPNVNKIFKCCTCNESDHYASKYPHKEKNYTINFKPKISRYCLYENKDDESGEITQNVSDDELRFITIKEDELDKEIREEKSLVS